MKSLSAAWVVNYPRTDEGTVGFTFSTTFGPGTFEFTFKWLNSQWNAWCKLPSGEVRPFGCIPGVVDWTEFMDYGILIESNYVEISQDNLVGGTTLYLLQWAAN